MATFWIIFITYWLVFFIISYTALRWEYEGIITRYEDDMKVSIMVGIVFLISVFASALVISAYQDSCGC